MCLPKELPVKAKKVAPAPPPRSPWRRLRQQLKPRLSRRVVGSSRINLNDCWSKFEEMSRAQMPIIEMSNVDNEINENILNEMSELSR